MNPFLDKVKAILKSLEKRSVPLLAHWSIRFGPRASSQRIMSRAWNYFKPHEVEGIDSETVAKADRGRGLSGIPWVITSGKRTPENNASVVGAIPESAHLSGRAIDLLCQDSHALYRLIRGALIAGFNRVGIYVREISENGKTKLVPVHVHLDDDPTKPPEVVWIKLEGKA